MGRSHFGSRLNGMGAHLGSVLGNSGLPEDPQDWNEKHKVKAALAMFDAYDKNGDDQLDSDELKLLFRDFASEMKLHYSVGSELTPSYEGIDAMVNTLHNPNKGPLTFLEFLPIFMQF